VMQVGRGQNNLNVNISLNNKVITSRRRQNLREVRRALPSSKALQGYKQFNVPDLHSQSAVLTNNMMSQFNNFRNEFENNQRAMVAQHEAFQNKEQHLIDALAAAGAAASGDDPESDDDIFQPSTAGGPRSEAAADARVQASAGRSAQDSPNTPTAARALFARMNRGSPSMFVAGMRPTSSREDSVEAMSSLRQGAEGNLAAELAGGGNQGEFT